MAPDTPEIRAVLERRALDRAARDGVRPGTAEFKAWWAEYGPSPRGVPPSVVEAEINNPGSTGVRVITNSNGDVVTVINGGRMDHNYRDLEVDLDGLTEVVGLPTRLSDPEVGFYWFDYSRRDGQTVSLTLNVYTRKVGVIVRCEAAGTTAAVNLAQCMAVRILDEGRRVLEVTTETSGIRVLLAFDGKEILDVSG